MIFDKTVWNVLVMVTTLSLSLLCHAIPCDNLTILSISHCLGLWLISHLSQTQGSFRAFPFRGTSWRMLFVLPLVRISSKACHKTLWVRLLQWCSRLWRGNKVLEMLANWMILTPASEMRKRVTNFCWKSSREKSEVGADAGLQPKYWWIVSTLYCDLENVISDQLTIHPKLKTSRK